LQQLDNAACCVVFSILPQEMLQMLQCRSRSPGSYRLLTRENGVCGREVRWQPKSRKLNDGCVY
jgi:hypothetical protein